MDYISQLPDCILSYILSMLSIKDALKTSIPSRRWRELLAFRRNVKFNIHNMLGTEKELLEAGYCLVEHLIDDSTFRDEFIKRVDQFVKNFQGTTIDSFLVDFSLNCQQSSIIDQWIGWAIAKGVGRIDLLLLGKSYSHRTLMSFTLTHEFAFRLFSESNASTLKHMHLQNCLVCHPTNFDFIPFTNLRSLVLEHAKVDEMFITSLLSNCLLLEELSLISCDFKSSTPKIVSSSLCHLEVTHCYIPFNYESSMPYINTLMLKSIKYSSFSLKIRNAFALFATLPQLEILHLDIHLMRTPSLKTTQPLKHLKQLNFIFNGDRVPPEEFDLLWILTILQASPLLQKLSVMVTYPKFFEDHKNIKDLEILSHEEARVIEMGGCVGNWYEIEFVMNVLKYYPKLERIILSPYWKDDDSFDWNSDPVWFQSGRERIRKSFQDEEVVGRAKLILT